MGCGIKCIRFIVGTISTVAFLVGVAGLVAGGFWLKKQNYKVNGGDFENINSVVAVSYFVLGGFLLLAGLIGIFASCCKNRCCSCLFAFLFALLSVVTIALGAVILNEVGKLEDEYNKHGCDNSPFDDLATAQNAMVANFCEGECGSGCDVSSEVQQKFGLPYTNKGPTNIQGCPNFDKFATDFMKKNKDFFKWMETTFHCSGACDKIDYYMWSDVNNTPFPTKSCVGEFMDDLKHDSKLYGGVAVGVGVVFLLLSTFGFCLCCHKDQEDERYNRF